MRIGRKQRQRDDRKARLQEAEAASSAVEERGEQVNLQLGLVAKLTEGWRKVHQVNHLAQLFRDEGRLG